MQNYAAITDKSFKPISETNPLSISVVEPQLTAYKVVLSAGVASDIKTSPGYIYAINTALNDLLVLDDTVVVWGGNYTAGTPFYNSTSIKLSSATGGTAYIVIK